MEMLRYYEKDAVKVKEGLSFQIGEAVFKAVKYKKGISICTDDGVQLVDYGVRVNDFEQAKSHFINTYKEQNMSEDRIEHFKKSVLKSVTAE